MSLLFQKRSHDDSRDEELEAKKNFKNAVVEAASKPSPVEDGVVPMEISTAGAALDDKSSTARNVESMDTTVAGFEATNKPSPGGD